MADLIFPCKMNSEPLDDASSPCTRRWGSLRLISSDTRAAELERIKKEMDNVCLSMPPASSAAGHKHPRDDDSALISTTSHTVPQQESAGGAGGETAAVTIEVRRREKTHESFSAAHYHASGTDVEQTALRRDAILLSYLHGDQPFFPSVEVWHAAMQRRVPGAMTRNPMPRRRWCATPGKASRQNQESEAPAEAPPVAIPVREDVHHVCRDGITQMLALLRALRALDTADYLMNVFVAPTFPISSGHSGAVTESVSSRCSRLVRLYAHLEALLLELDDVWQQCNGKVVCGPTARGSGVTSTTGSAPPPPPGVIQQLWTSVVERAFACMDAFEMTVVFDLFLSLHHAVVDPTSFESDVDVKAMEGAPQGGYVAYLKAMLSGYSRTLQEARWPARLLCRSQLSSPSLLRTAATERVPSEKEESQENEMACIERLRQTLLHTLKPVGLRGDTTSTDTRETVGDGRGVSADAIVPPPSSSSSLSWAAAGPLSGVWDGVTVMLMRAIYALQAADTHNLLGTATRPPLGVIAAALQKEAWEMTPEGAQGQQEYATGGGAISSVPGVATSSSSSPVIAISRLLEDVEGYHRVCAMAWSGRYGTLGLYRAMADMQAVFLALVLRQQQQQQQQKGILNVPGEKKAYGLSDSAGWRGRGRGRAPTRDAVMSGASSSNGRVSSRSLFVSNDSVVQKTSVSYVLRLWHVWLESLASEFEAFLSSGGSMSINDGARTLLRHRPSIFQILTVPSEMGLRESELTPTQQAALRVLEALRAKDSNGWCSTPSLRVDSLDFTAIEIWIQSAAFSHKNTREAFFALRNVLDAIVDACVRQLGPTDERSTAMTTIRQHFVNAAQKERLLQYQ